jgi:hypothetical protein
MSGADSSPVAENCELLLLGRLLGLGCRLLDGLLHGLGLRSALLHGLLARPSCLHALASWRRPSSPRPWAAFVATSWRRRPSSSASWSRPSPSSRRPSPLGGRLLALGDFDLRDGLGGGVLDDLRGLLLHFLGRLHDGLGCGRRYRESAFRQWSRRWSARWASVPACGHGDAGRWTHRTGRRLRRPPRRRAARCRPLPRPRPNPRRNPTTSPSCPC